MKKINTLAELKELIKNAKSAIYVRWSRGVKLDKKRGSSRDYVSGETHTGLSSVAIDADWIDDDARLARRILEYRFLRSKDVKIGCHIYAGRRVGADSDGYDLIIDIEGIASLSNRLINSLDQLKQSSKTK